MNICFKKDRKKLHIFVAILLLLLLIAIILFAGNKIKSTVEREDAKIAEAAVRNYAAQCYALEGSYPRSIEYLCDNYPLTINKDRYVYHYNYIGDNMMPDISVFPIEQ